MLAPEDVALRRVPVHLPDPDAQPPGVVRRPLILLAQNRQEDRDKVIAEQDRQANARAHADMEFLAREVASLRMAVGEVATRDFLRSELRGLLGELDERGPSTPRATTTTTARATVSPTAAVGSSDYAGPS